MKMMLVWFAAGYVIFLYRYYCKLRLNMWDVFDDIMLSVNNGRICKKKVVKCKNENWLFWIVRFKLMKMMFIWFAAGDIIFYIDVCDTCAWICELFLMI